MTRLVKIFLWGGFSGLVGGLLALPALAATPATLPASLPLYFETDPGGASAPGQFVARGCDYQFTISATEVQIGLRKATDETAGARMQWVGANPRAGISGTAGLPGKINYLTGNDPGRWRTGMAMFRQVRVDAIYPDINLVYYGNQQRLEYDFTLAPGADPGAIAMRFDGVDKISIDPAGELVLKLNGGEIRQPRPVIYQRIGGVRKDITGGYRLLDAQTVAFAVGAYDHGQALTIDPLLSYSTYFGGTAGDRAWAVAVDTNGIIYIAGETFSPKFFTNGWPSGTSFSTFGAFQTNYNGGKYAGDAFIAKLSVDPADSTDVTAEYLTYLGGNGDNAAYSLAVDPAGNAYVAGYTDATNFPTRNAIPGHATISGVRDPVIKLYPSDAFAAELDASGSNLVYSTYLGGSGADVAYGVAVDSLGHTFVTGFTFSTNFPTTPNAMFRTLQCSNTFYFNANAFVTEIASNGSALVYSTYFGGTNYDFGKGIAVDSSNFVYLTGFTASTNFPVTNAVSQLLVQTKGTGTNQVIFTNLVNGALLNGTTNKTDRFDAFVTKFDYSSGTNLVPVYSTFLGGTNNDFANHIAVDNSGAAYVIGSTISSNFPSTVAGLYSFVATNTRAADLSTNVFLTKITNGPGTSAGIAWSALFGGRGVDEGNSVAVGPGGDVFATGSATSTNFPVINLPGLLTRTNSGKGDAFVIAFDSTGTNVLYSTYLGGRDKDFGYGIAVDASNNAYVVGQTLSTNFPSAGGALNARNGTNDAFLTKIFLTVPAPEIATNGQPSGQTNSTGSTITFTVAGTANDVFPPYTLQWQKGDTNFVGTNVVNGGRISGATNVTLTITNAQPADSGNYWIVVTNYGGAITSSIAVLLITNVPPDITVQPTNQTVGLGTAVTLAVTATGTAPLSYQWHLNGTNVLDSGGHLTGATGSALTISGAQLTDSGTYTVIVTNLAGSVTSSNAVLTVTAPPLIVVEPPASQLMTVGSSAAFAAIAVGAAPLHYQWQVNGTNLSNGGRIRGATSATLTITNAQTTDSAPDYQVIVTNIYGAATSSPSLLLVTNIPPAITAQPVSRTVGAGSNVTFAVTATGTAPLQYQWQFNGTNLLAGGRISGVTNATLTVSNTQTNDTGSYSVIVTNPGGSTNSSAATLTVYLAPVIVTQPASQTLPAGSAANFTVAAIGMAPLHYQWQAGGVNLVNGGRISGATNATLTINNTQSSDSTNYSVVVTNLAGSVTSSAAVLTVTNMAPTITSQPADQAVAAGSIVTLTVGVIGTAPLSYTWQENGTNLVDGRDAHGATIIGSTNRALVIKNAQTNNSGSYSVIITNIVGATNSSAAVLTVAAAPVILTQPTNESLAVGSTAVLAVSVVGITPLFYQWQMNGNTLTNATNNVLAIANAQTTNNGSYRVFIRNRIGGVFSTNAVLTVTNVPPTITLQPTNQTVGVGSTVTNVVLAFGTSPLSYQWLMNGTNLVDGTNADGSTISGATNTVLILGNMQTNDNGNYTVIVTNLGGSATSSNAVLTAVAAPLITAQPTNQTAGAGSTITLTIAAIGEMPLSYQWTDGTNLLANATNNVLIIPNAQTNDTGSYSCTVTNDFGQATSSNAVVTVVPLSFGNIIAVPGGGFILSGAGGTNNGLYYVLVSSNLLVPLTNWTHLETNHFDSQGRFIFTNTTGTSGQLFYLLKY